MEIFLLGKKLLYVNIRDNPPVQSVEEQDNTEEKNKGKREGLLLVLQELEREEGSLLEKKQELLNLEEKLQLKIKEEIDARKCKIEALKNEVSELRRQCEELAGVLNIPVCK